MEQVTYDMLISAIGSLGFPIVIAFYVLFRLDKTLKSLSTDIRELKDALYRTRLDPPTG